MPIFTGQFDRSIDAKSRLQLPAQLRTAIDPQGEGAPLYITLGENPNTLSIFTEAAFNELAERIPTQIMSGLESRRFERQFYSSTCRVDMDKQGRFVLPDRLRKKAKLADEVSLIGQKHRIEIWNRSDLERELGIEWEGDAWPDWQSFLRMPPKETS